MIEAAVISMDLFGLEMLPQLRLDDDQSFHQFITFWDLLVSTWNPKTHPSPSTYPSLLTGIYHTL
jgi:hypothetical protein